MQMNILSNNGVEAAHITIALNNYYDPFKCSCGFTLHLQSF